jgi:hypothetical protein
MLRNIVLLFAAAVQIGTAFCAEQIVKNPSVTGVLNFDGGPMYDHPLAGYDFTPKTTLIIDYLGVFDDRSNGLNGPHLVGLFVRESGQAIASTRIDNSCFVEAAFRWRSIKPVVLQPGVRYNLTAFNGSYDEIMANYQSVFTFSPDITINAGYISGLDTSLKMATREGGPGAVFIGPAFGSSVPEPSTFALFLSACAGLLIVRARLNAGRRRESV